MVYYIISPRGKSKNDNTECNKLITVLFNECHGRKRWCYFFFPLAGSGCLPNTLRCSDWDVARQPHHPCCCSASGTQVGAYVDLTLKEQKCWGVEGGLPGKILDWAEAQGARPYLNHHRHQTETPRGTARPRWLCTHNWKPGSALSQRYRAVILLDNPDCLSLFFSLYFFAKCFAKCECLTGWTSLYCGCKSKTWKHEHESER